MGLFFEIYVYVCAHQYISIPPSHHIQQPTSKCYILIVYFWFYGCWVFMTLFWRHSITAKPEARWKSHSYMMDKTVKQLSINLFLNGKTFYYTRQICDAPLDLSISPSSCLNWLQGRSFFFFPLTSMLGDIAMLKEFTNTQQQTSHILLRTVLSQRCWSMALQFGVIVPSFGSTLGVFHCMGTPSEYLQSYCTVTLTCSCHGVALEMSHLNQAVELQLCMPRCAVWKESK